MLNRPKSSRQKYQKYFFLPYFIFKIHKKVVEKINKGNKQMKRESFAQATKVNAASLFKLYKAFLALPSQKIIEMYKINNQSSNK